MCVGASAHTDNGDTKLVVQILSADNGGCSERCCGGDRGALQKLTSIGGLRVHVNCPFASSIVTG
jgi:hypothetical protein